MRAISSPQLLYRKEGCSLTQGAKRGSMQRLGAALGDYRAFRFLTNPGTRRALRAARTVGLAGSIAYAGCVHHQQKRLHARLTCAINLARAQLWHWRPRCARRPGGHHEENIGTRINIHWQREADDCRQARVVPRPTAG